MRSGALALLVVACASPGAPPGGPPDNAPPILLEVSPDSGAVNVKADAVVLRFDEVVSERGGARAGTGAIGAAPGGAAAAAPSGGSALDKVVLLSPTSGRDRISWKRSGLEIAPRGGFRPNTAYRVTLLPGISDLRGNATRSRRELVFSTGPTLPEGEIRGALFDWVAGRPAAGARVEVFVASDTTFRWVTATDSAGRYAVRDLAPGEYSVRGWVDANSDRGINGREPFDTAHVRLETQADLELYVFDHDTIGPRIESVELVDSTAIRIRLDRPVAPAFTPDSLTFALLASDSSVIAVGPGVPGATFDSIRAANAPRDTAAPVAPADPAAPPTRPDPTGRAAPAPAAARPAIQPAPPAANAPPMNRPVPIATWVVALRQPLAPGTYRIRVRGVPGLAGASRESDRELRVRPPPPPK